MLVVPVGFAGVFADSGAVPVSATSVGFDAAPPRQSSICECTLAAASLAEPTALTWSADGMRRIAPRFSALMLSL